MIDKIVPNILERKVEGYNCIIKIELTDRLYDSGAINITYLNKEWKLTLRNLSRKIVEKRKRRVEGINLKSDQAIEKIKNNFLREYDGEIIENYVLEKIKSLLKQYKKQLNIK